MPTTEPLTRRFHLTPGHCLLALLAVEFLLFLSQWFRWLPKGWPVLIAAASVAVTILAMFLWFVVALAFRRRFQFSIRSLLVLTVAVALPCSWFAMAISQAKDQREALRGIFQADGLAYYDYEVDVSGEPVGNEPPRPVWLRNLLGDGFFSDAVCVHLGIPRFGSGPFKEDEGTENLKRLPHLKVLVLSDLVTDAGVMNIRTLPQLERLSLAYSQITDAGLQNLSGLTNLQELSLKQTAVTDAGLFQLMGLTTMRKLILTETKVTDAGVAKLQQALPNCKIQRQHEQPGVFWRPLF